MDLYNDMIAEPLWIVDNDNEPMWIVDNDNEPMWIDMKRNLCGRL